MRRMAMGAPGGMPDSSDEEISMGQSADEDDAEQDGEDGDEDGFFSGEEGLQDVEIEGDEEEDDEGEDLPS